MKLDLLTYNGKPKSFIIDNDLSTRMYSEKQLIVDTERFLFFPTDPKKKIYSDYDKAYRLSRIPAYPNDVQYIKGTCFVLLCQELVGNNHSHFCNVVLLSLLIAKKYGINLNKVPIVTKRLNNKEKEFISLFQKNINIIEIDRNAHMSILFEHAIFTDSQYDLYRGISYNSAQLFLDLRNNLKINKKFKDKIYISRKDSKNRQAVNEDEVIQYMLKRDFEIVDLAKLSALDQISAFKYAKVIAGPHGAGGANLYFSDNEVNFIEFFSEKQCVAFHAKIAVAKNCYYNGTVNKALTSLSMGDYQIDIQLLEQALDSSIKINESVCNHNFFEPFKYDIIDKNENFYIPFNDEKDMLLNVQKRIKNFHMYFPPNTAYLHRAIIEFNKGNINKACEIQFELCKSFSDNKLYLDRLCFLLRITLDVEMLNTLTTEIITKHPMWGGEVYYSLAFIYEKKKNFLEGVIQAQKALELEPQNQKYKDTYERLFKEQQKIQPLLTKNLNDKIEEFTKEFKQFKEQSEHMQHLQEQINKQQIQIKQLQEQGILMKKFQIQIDEQQIQIDKQQIQINQLLDQVKILIEKSKQVKASSYHTLKNIIFQPFLKKKAFALCNAEQILEAEAIAQRIIQNTPYMAWAYYILGRVQRKRGEFDLALESYQKAINLDPTTEYFVKEYEECLKE